MIKIKEKNKKKKNDPYYMLVYNYMIGDSNGNTSKEVIVSLDNPYLERYCLLLNKLQPTPGHWGVSLEKYRIKKHIDAKQITEDDCKFLSILMFEESEYEDKEEYLGKDNIDFADEFYEGVRAEAEYSFLVFEGVDLFYIDEYGIEHETEIV